jgi:ABC-type sulfate transport system permease subunit
VLILVSLRQLLQQVCKVPLSDVAENLLGMVQADMLCEEESFFGKNYSKTIIKLTFAIAMVVDGSSSF